MKTEVKAALVGTVGVVLLLGGAGTLAYWSDTEAVTGDSTLQSGHLRLVTDTTNAGCGGWTLDAGEAIAGTYSAGDPLVPGDVLTKVCNFTVEAEGNHLRGTLGLATPTVTLDAVSTGALDGMVTVATPVIEVDGNPQTSITEGDNGKTVTGTIVVRFDVSALNTTQDFAAALADTALTVTQVHG